MKNPRIVQAYNSINPSAAQKQRMLEAILAQASPEEPPKKKREPVVYTAKATKTSPWSLITGVAACLAVVILGGFVLLRVVGNQKPTPNFADPQTSQTTEATEPATTDAEDVYADVLDLYERALENGWTQEQCRANDISPQILTALPKLGWCLKDLNGDGIAELVISDTQKLYDVYAMPPTNASAIHVVCAEGTDAYTLLADNTIIKQGFYSGATNWEFYRWNDDTLSMDYMVRYEGSQYSDGSASYFYGTSIDDLKPISEDDAENRITASQPAQLELTLFAAQPKQSVNSVSIYNPVISLYQQALTEKWNPGKCEEAGIGMMIGWAYDYLGKLGYAIQDIDKDGVDELIITDGENIYALYTITQEEEAAPVCLFTAYERIQYYLTQENQIYCRGSGGAAVSYYTLYRLAGQKLIQLDGYMYDGETDPNNPWYFYDGDQQGDSCGSLDVQAILDGIQIAKITFAPFDYDCPNE